MTLTRARASALVFLAALALYLPALRNGFAYDDVPIVERDARVHSLGSIPSFFGRGYWADEELALYRPLTTASFAIDWAVSGGNPAWFMFTNALWNAAAAVLVLLLLAQIVPLGAAFGGALLFAVHPVHVEAVANVVGRADVIAAVFCLGAMLVWMRGEVGAAAGRTAAVAALFALALLTKESAIMLPALLVLCDAATGRLTPASARAWLRDRALPLGILALVAVAYLGVRALVLGGLAPSRLDAALEVTAGGGRLVTALQAWPVYARLLFVPVTLLADYGPRILMPAEAFTANALAGALMLLALVAGGVAAWLRGHGRVALAMLWLPVAILPVSNLIVPIGIIVAERTLYLPSVALAAGVALVLERSLLTNRIRRAAPLVLTAAVLLFAARTVVRIPEWRSTDAIFAALLRDRPDSFRAHWHHARLAAVAGQPDVALERYARALQLWPWRERLVVETMRVASRAGYLDYARGLGAFAAEQWPVNAEAARMHAAATLDLGDSTSARLIVDNALRRIPGDSILLRMRDAITNRNTP